MAATKVDRDAVCAALYAQWSVLEQLLRMLDAAQWRRTTALPGWTVHDIAAHIIGTEAMLDGQPTPPAPESVTGAAHVRGAIGAINERWVESMRTVPPSELMDRWTAITARRRRALEAMPQDEFDAVAETPVGPESYGRFMRVRVFDCWMHELDIRDAVGLPGDEGGPRAQVAFAEIAGAVPFLVGKRAQAPEGAHVRLALTGPLARTLDIRVTDGRAAVVDAAQDAPAVTVTVPSGVFVRLAGGRVAPEAVRDRIRVDARDADSEGLGRRIPEVLAFTI